MADRCGRCGTEVVPDHARFCHQCGVRLDVEVTEIDLGGFGLVDAEPTGDTGAEFSPLKVLAAMVAIVVIGAAAFSMLTGEAPESEDAAGADDSVADESTAESEEVEVGEDEPEPPEPDLSTGSILRWNEVAEMGNGLPIGVVDFDGATWLFVRSITDDDEPHRIQAWRSINGLEWEPRGPVMAPGIDIGAITANSTELIGVGTDADDRPMVWRSPDGFTWESEALPASDDVEFTPNLVAATDDSVVVVGGFGGLVQYQEFIDELAAHLDINRSIVDLGHWSFNGNEFTVRGAFDIELISVRADEVDDSLREIIDSLNRPGPMTPAMWTLGADGEWTVIEQSPGTWIHSLTSTGTGFVMTGFGLERPVLSTSEDGLEWEDASTGTGQVYGTTAWGERFVSIGASSSRDLVVSTGDDEERISPTGLLPGGFDWWLQQLTADDRSVVVLASGFSGFEGPQTASAVLLKDGFRLEADTSDAVVLYDEGGRPALVDPFRSPDTYRVDLEAEEVTLHDPEAGVDLITFSLQDLAKLQQSVYSTQPNERFTALYSDDGSVWNIGRIRTIERDGGTDGSAYVDRLHLTDDHIIVIAVRRSTLNNSASQVEIHAAERP